MLDNIDYKILDILQEDGRIPFQNLGKKVGLTRQAVSRRVKKMIDNGFIRRFCADLDHERLGRGIIAYVDIIFKRSFTPEVEKRALNYISAINGVRSANTTVGEKYITVRIYTGTIQELNQIIRSIQNDIPDISTRTVIVNELFFTNKKIAYSRD
ncbi:MAG: Lrp/AsnC family transcriptional regulator [FCB group bacterium]|nr:Lrp/AsnC family transcriptional regulator [FCB group bacterium]